MAQKDAETILRAIRSHCLDCMGGSREQVAKCTSVRCSLHDYRMGAQEAQRYYDAGDDAKGIQLCMLDSTGGG